MTACAAELTVGAPIVMTVQLGDRVRDQMEFVSEVVAGERFEYRMKPVGPLLFSYRQHDIATISETRTLYRSTFALKGWISPIVGLALGGALRDGFQGMTESLVSRAEILVAGVGCD